MTGRGISLANRAAAGILLTVLSLWLIGCPAGVSGSSVVLLDLRQLAGLSDFIFAGTVMNIESEWTPSHETIVTHVTFGQIFLAKGGEPLGNIMLTINGGRVGLDEIIADGVPQFELAGRYVVFASRDFGSERNCYLPIVGLFQGVYRICNDMYGQKGVVHDWLGRPISDIRNGHIVVIDNRARAEKTAPSSFKTTSITAVPVSQKDFAPKKDILVKDVVRFSSAAFSGVAEKPTPRNEKIAAVSKVSRPIVPSPVPVEVMRLSEDTGERLTEEEFLKAIGELTKPGD